MERKATKEQLKHTAEVRCRYSSHAEYCCVFQLLSSQEDFPAEVHQCLDMLS